MYVLQFHFFEYQLHLHTTELHCFTQRTLRGTEISSLKSHHNEPATIISCIAVNTLLHFVPVQDMWQGRLIIVSNIRRPNLPASFQWTRQM